MIQEDFQDHDEQIQNTQFDDIEDGENKSLGKAFRLIKKIDSGSFGDIYLGKNLETNREVAVKIESVTSKTPLLLYEAKVYQYILKEKELSLAEKLWQERQPKIEKGFPEVYYCSNEGDYNILIMQMLGPNLEDLFQICSKKFSVKTVCMIGLQILERIKFLHSRFMVHRDIKPSNFCIGIGQKKHIIYMIDLAFCKKWANKDGSHIQNREGKSLTGTLLFASLNSHKGFEQSRRDDIESFAYMLIYFLKGGNLPWATVKYSNKKEKIERTVEKKQANPEQYLLKNIQIQEFKDIFLYAQGLEFEQEPDYDMIKQKLESVLEQQEEKNDYVYTWNIVAQGKGDDIKSISNPQPIGTMTNFRKSILQ